MTPLEKQGFYLENGTWKHKRAPLRAVTSKGDSQVRIIYDLPDDFFAKIIVDVDNTHHEVLMGLTEIKKVLGWVNEN